LELINVLNLPQQLANCSLFQGKSVPEIEQLLKMFIYRNATFQKDEIIFSPNHPAETMGIILSGKVEVQKVFPSGKLVLITRKTAYDLCAEPSIFSRATHYPNQVSACKPCRMILIHKNEVLKLLRLDQTVVLNFLKSVSDSMLVLKHKIGILSLNSIQAKIAAFLFHELNHAGNDHSVNLITLPFSKKAWSEYLNVSRTSLARELKKMATAQLITVDKKIIIINEDISFSLELKLTGWTFTCPPGITSTITSSFC
jgi:CRP-like cAMP-binding protein